MQSSRWLVEHIEHAEQAGSQLRGQPQPLQFSRRHRRSAATEREIAEAEIDEYLQARDEVRGDHGGNFRQLTGFRRLVSWRSIGPRSSRAQHVSEVSQRHRRVLGDGAPGESHLQRLRPQPGALTQRAIGAFDELQHATAHHRAVGVRQCVTDMALGAGKRAVVVIIRLHRMLGRIDLDSRLLIGEQDPIALPLREFAPRLVDVIPERDEDVAQVLPLPGPRPRCDGALTDGQRRVRHQCLFGHPVDASEPVTLWTRSDRGVRGEGVGIQSFRGAGRVGTGAGEQHPQQVRQGGDGADRRPRRGRASALLQGDGRR